MNRKSASTSAQNAKNVSDCSSIQQEFCKIDLRGVVVAIGPDGRLFPSGKKSS
jgi:hypothetical protein